ncbi:hypothetical protein SAMN05444004_11131 [Jannaschia faecimaris]|uniref:Uncharacterized protein n=1 Tax=Jannaschia faecimaris TaxID=1244108 RepID=A0A1H3S9Y3_9RHOB|nr:hypothetical protein SAMN05444004_11131 [Jannaschia faecimaris]
MLGFRRRQITAKDEVSFWILRADVFDARLDAGEGGTHVDRDVHKASDRRSHEQIVPEVGMPPLPNLGVELRAAPRRVDGHIHLLKNVGLHLINAPFPYLWKQVNRSAPIQFDFRQWWSSQTSPGRLACRLIAGTG